MNKCKSIDRYNGFRKPKCNGGDPCDGCIEKYLQRRGWETYYNSNYWVNKKTVFDPQVQDYTNYGMTLRMAFLYETNGCPKYKLHPIRGFVASGFHMGAYYEGELDK